MLSAGTMPTPESGAAEEVGNAEEAGEACTEAPGAGEGAVAPAAACCFISSRRNALSPLVFFAYKIDNAKVITKKNPANQPVNFTSTLVVCAPKRFSVMPPPNAAPKPSLFGRCIKMTRIMSSAIRHQIVNRTLIRIDIGTGNMAKPGAEANVQRSTFNVQFRS